LGGQLRDLNRGTERLVYPRCVWRWLSSWRGEVVGGGMLTVSATVAGQLHERPAWRRTGNRRWNWSWSRSSGGAIASVSIIRVCTSCEVTQQTLSRFTPRRNMSDNKGAIYIDALQGCQESTDGLRSAKPSIHSNTPAHDSTSTLSAPTNAPQSCNCPGRILYRHRKSPPRDTSRNTENSISTASRFSPFVANLKTTSAKPKHAHPPSVRAGGGSGPMSSRSAPPGGSIRAYVRVCE